MRFKQKNIGTAFDQTQDLLFIVVNNLGPGGFFEIGLGLGNDIIGRPDGTGNEQRPPIIVRRGFIPVFRLSGDSAALNIQVPGDGRIIRLFQVQLFRNGLDIGKVNILKVKFGQTQGRSPEGVGLDQVGPRLQVFQVDAFQVIRTRKNQEIGQHFKRGTAESRILQHQVLHHGPHGSIQEKNLGS